MPTNDESEQDTQQTPKGATIPVPTREQVFRDLEKVARPKKRRSTPRSRPEK